MFFLSRTKYPTSNPPSASIIHHQQNDFLFMRLSPTRKPCVWVGVKEKPKQPQTFFLEVTHLVTNHLASSTHMSSVALQSLA
jgi:hypothetical protein